MEDYAKVGRYALYGAVGSAIFMLCLFVFWVSMPLPVILAAMGLVPLGGAVVAALMAFSFEDPEHE